MYLTKCGPALPFQVVHAHLGLVELLANVDLRTGLVRRSRLGGTGGASRHRSLRDLRRGHVDFLWTAIRKLV